MDILRDRGYEFLEAGGGGAVQYLVDQERPDIILLDVMMPVMGGIQVLRLK